MRPSITGSNRVNAAIARHALLFSAALLLSACGPPPPQGVEIQGQRLPVIDMHLHTGTWELTTPRFQERLTERLPGPLKLLGPVFFARSLSGESIVNELDKAGITSGGLFALYSPHSTGIAPNELVEQEVAAWPGRLYGFASLRVDQWNVNGPDQLARLETALHQDHMVGIKLAHGHQQFRFDDPRFYGIYEIAGRLKKPVYLHTGTSPNPGTRTEPPYADPAYLELAIQRFPDAIFILGHTGYDSAAVSLTFTDSAIALAQRYSNVYLEPGALGAERADPVRADFLARIRRGGVVARMIYGSDGPQRPGYVKTHLERFVAGMVAAGFTVEEMRMVLAGNFTRVFKLPPISLREARG